MARSTRSSQSFRYEQLGYDVCQYFRSKSALSGSMQCQKTGESVAPICRLTFVVSSNAIEFEKAAVLYNCAIVYYKMGQSSLHSISSDGIKIACSHFSVLL